MGMLTRSEKQGPCMARAPGEGSPRSEGRHGRREEAAAFCQRIHAVHISRSAASTRRCSASAQRLRPADLGPPCARWEGVALTAASSLWNGSARKMAAGPRRAAWTSAVRHLFRDPPSRGKSGTPVWLCRGLVKRRTKSLCRLAPRRTNSPGPSRRSSLGRLPRRLRWPAFDGGRPHARHLLQRPERSPWQQRSMYLHSPPHPPRHER